MWLKTAPDRKENMENGKYYYTAAGLMVRLVEEIIVNNKPAYVVIDEQEIEQDEDYGGDAEIDEQPLIVYQLFEKEQDTPIMGRKSQLQTEIEDLYEKASVLRQELNDLTAQKKENISVFNPKYKPGDFVYTVGYRGAIEQTRIDKVAFYLYRDKSSIEYSDSSYNGMVPLTLEEATVKSQEVIKERAEYEQKNALEAYQKAKQAMTDYEATHPKVS